MGQWGGAWMIFSANLLLSAGWLGVSNPGGVPSRASGAEGERDARGPAGGEGQRGSSAAGDGHHSQASTYQHITRVS